MSKKRDIRQVEAIASEFNMNPDERREFGDYLEDCKRSGERGSGADGDFSFDELRAKARAFRGEK